MGQKVHPTGFRLGFNKTWRSRWYADKEYADLLHEDLKLKKDLKKRFAHAGVSRIDVERAANKAKVYVYAARPGMISLAGGVPAPESFPLVLFHSTRICSRSDSVNTGSSESRRSGLEAMPVSSV